MFPVLIHCNAILRNITLLCPSPGFSSEAYAHGFSNQCQISFGTRSGIAFLTETITRDQN